MGTPRRASPSEDPSLYLAFEFAEELGIKVAVKPARTIFYSSFSHARPATALDETDGDSWASRRSTFPILRAISVGSPLQPHIQWKAAGVIRDRFARAPSPTPLNSSVRSISGETTLSRRLRSVEAPADAPYSTEGTRPSDHLAAELNFAISRTRAPGNS